MKKIILILSFILIKGILLSQPCYNWFSYEFSWGVGPRSIGELNQNIWVGTIDNGIYSFQNKNFSDEIIHFDMSNTNLPSNNIQDIIGFNNILFVNANNILVIKDNEDWITNAENPNIPVDCYDFYIKQNNLFIGGNGVVFKTNTGYTYEIIGNNILPSFPICNLAIEKYSDNFWFSKTSNLTGVGVYLFDGNSCQNFTSSNSPLPHNNVNDITIDENNNIWISTDNGLAKYSSGTWEIFNTSNTPFESNDIQNIGKFNNTIYACIHNSNPSISDKLYIYLNSIWYEIISRTSISDVDLKILYDSNDMFWLCNGFSITKGIENIDIIANFTYEIVEIHPNYYQVIIYCNHQYIHSDSVFEDDSWNKGRYIINWDNGVIDTTYTSNPQYSEFYNTYVPDTINVSLQYKNTCSTTESCIVAIILGVNTEIDELAINENLFFYTVNSDYLSINPQKNDVNYNIEIFNTEGKLLNSKSNCKGLEAFYLPFSGFYIVKIRQNSKVIILKVLR